MLRPHLHISTFLRSGIKTAIDHPPFKTLRSSSSLIITTWISLLIYHRQTTTSSLSSVMSSPAPVCEPEHKFPSSTRTCLSTIGRLYEGLKIPRPQPRLPSNPNLSTRVYALFHPLITDHHHSQQPNLTATLNTAILNTVQIYPLHPLNTQVYITVQIFFHDYIREHLLESRSYDSQHDLRAIITQLGAGISCWSFISTMSARRRRNFLRPSWRGKFWRRR